MFCQFCGTVLDETARFCKSCAKPTGEVLLVMSFLPLVAAAILKILIPVRSTRGF